MANPVPLTLGIADTDDKDRVRLRLDLAYDGTDFHGWAAQKPERNLRTVQSTLEEALELILRHPIKLTVAGRTDAGVHASGQVAHFDIPWEALDTRSIHGEPATLVRRLARLLPQDVRVHDCSYAPEGFDARFSALRRHYLYRVTTAERGALPTRHRDTATWGRKVDFQALCESTTPLIGLHDFAAFCKARPNSTTIRDLQVFSWKDVSTAAEPETYEATVVADAFCWSMVRSLVGATLAVADGRRGSSFTREMLQETARHPQVPLAPACGLTLTGVDYPEGTELAERAIKTRALRSLEVGN